MPEANISDLVAHPLAKYRNHLEFNGYQVEEDEELLLCHHPRKTNLIIKYIFSRGVLIRSFYSFDQNIQRIDLLEYINELNSDFIFMKAYIDRDNDLSIETFSEGEYDRTNFSILLDNIEYDMGIFGNHKLTQEYLH
ncbi:YbjN domain-containing protein [Plectonema radiosum NIES-515]|uniref:YbjN domain-containing protein n=1 Tax=Plectonema radiosum NIES-515 TaxID=2986073 RepID=A0ABT3B600_9CYAN|nr:YbjN domain-containing protein [Plectonema radiosum]MCV3216797.1 YbjN domain-containing protein [Plectonema radiosum NIES-515]